MSTTDSVFLIITAVALSLFFLIASCLLIYIGITYRQIVKRTQAALDGLEAAKKMIQEVGGGRLFKTVYKMMRYLTGNVSKG